MANDRAAEDVFECWSAPGKSGRVCSIEMGGEGRIGTKDKMAPGAEVWYGWLGMSEDGLGARGF